MKRLLISLLLTAAVWGGAVWEVWFVGRQADAYTARLETADALLRARNTAAAARICSAAARDWEREVSGLDVLLIHDYVDNIGYSLAKMCVHLENDQPALYFAESAQTKKALASVKGSEYPFVENIL